MADSKGRILFITTVAMTQNLFMRGQAEFLRVQGFDVHHCASPGPHLEELGSREGTTTHAIPITRKISPVRDLISLFRLIGLCMRLRPRILCVSTPKAALLGSIAGFIARIPVRVFLMRGLLSSGATGKKKSVFSFTEKLTCRLCHEVLAVSKSLLLDARKRGLLEESKGKVLCNGMSNGVKTKWLTEKEVEELPVDAGEVLNELSDKKSVVFGFVGRLCPDKGIEELLDAWPKILETNLSAVLVLVGPLEVSKNHPLRKRVKSAVNVYRLDYLDRSAMGHLYRCLDVLLFPSHREGFPNVPVEAAAFAVPVVTTDAVGCVDAVVDGETGIVVPVGDSAALAEAAISYLTSPDLRLRHGIAGQERVEKDFNPQNLWQAYSSFFSELAE